MTAKVPLSDVPSRFEPKLLHGLWRRGRKLDSQAPPAALSCPVCCRVARGAASGAQHSASGQAWSWQGEREIALFTKSRERGFLKPV